MYKTDTSRWQAVSNRDSAATNSFIYAVRTTKIFCRPDCPSRLARRANVEFFDDTGQAADAGYRPCKRCKPDSISPAQDTINKAKWVIHQNRDVTLNELASEVGMSARYLHTLFSRVVGCTPAAYSGRLRCGEENELIEDDAGFKLAEDTRDCETFHFDQSAESSGRQSLLDDEEWLQFLCESEFSFGSEDSGAWK